MTRDQADVALTGLGMISLTDFKTRAERRGYSISRETPGAPDAHDTGPGLIPFVDPGPAPIADSGLNPR